MAYKLGEDGEIDVRYSGRTVMHKCCFTLLQSHLADPEHESFGVAVPECQSDFDINFPLIVYKYPKPPARRPQRIRSPQPEARRLWTIHY